MAAVTDFMKRIINFLLLLFLAIITGIAYADCEEDWLKSKSANGSILIFSMGSIWEVDPIDRLNSMFWLPTDDVLICDEEGILINRNSGEKVGARQIR